MVVVTGLSGAGKASILRVLEDCGYEAVDNPPLLLMEELVGRGEGPMAVGVDARSRGFDARAVLAVMARLRGMPGLRPELVFAAADEAVLLRRFTETRRRHPMAPRGQVTDGIAAETAMLAPLREAADLVIDTSEMPLPAMRGRVEALFGAVPGGVPPMTVSLISFSYPAGVPREADLVFDARFLRNPHYDPILRDRTGLDPSVGAYVEADPDYEPFVEKITDLLGLLLPRFVREGKKYASVAIGCTGGRHRSVHLVEVLARRLEPGGGTPPWRVTVVHRDMNRTARQGPDTGLHRWMAEEGGATKAGPRETVQAQEA